MYTCIKKKLGPWNCNHTLPLLLFLIGSLILSVSCFYFLRIKELLLLLFRKGELKSDSASLTNIERFSWFLTLYSYQIENQRSSYMSDVCVCVCSTLSIIDTEVIWPLIILIVFINVACFSTYKIDYNIVYWRVNYNVQYNYMYTLA